jgi:mRNA-degrading endonuclease RelE of RelBE toxin-antitoxin system
MQAAIELRADNPRPPGAVALQGRSGLRIRVGDYGIVYQVQDNVLVVAVIALGHRGDIYRTRQAALWGLVGITRPSSFIRRGGGWLWA